MNKTKSSTIKNTGFTLIELMIVVAIIGILAAIAIPKFADLISKSKEGASKKGLAVLRSAISVYYADTEGLYPTDDLACLTENGKYLSEIPTAYVPGRHAKNNTVQNNDDLGMGMLLFADTGGWMYWNWTMSDPTRRQGDVWLGCTHQDSKGKIWSSY